MNLWRLLRGSVALRLTLYASLLAVLTSALLLAIFYTQSHFVLQAQFARQVGTTAQRLLAHFAQGGQAALVREMEWELADPLRTEAEVLALLDARGRVLAGNVTDWPGADMPGADAAGGHIRRVLLRGWPLDVYAVTRHLPDGARLVVGQDIRNLHQMTRQLRQLLGWATFFILVVTVLGASLFRSALQQRVEVIRRTARQVGGGLLHERVPPTHAQDEFALLGHDINHMLEQIGQLMGEVRHVSDAVAHNLRTPITRILLGLRPALRPGSTEAELRQALEFARAQLEGLGQLLEKLLQLAELESGARSNALVALDLAAIVRDMVELYAAFAAEAGGSVLLHAPEGPVPILGDRDLLASALSNLMDNALKYAGPAARVDIQLVEQGGRVILSVADNGPGIAPEAQGRLGQRFYRAGHPGEGHGLGLASVVAIARLHGAVFRVLPARQGTAMALDFPALA